MTKSIRLTRGYADIVDVSDYPAFREHAARADKLADGREVPKYVFHALEGASPALDLRGRPTVVTDEQALELLTTPREAGMSGLTFEEVPQEQWEREMARARATGLYSAAPVLEDPAPVAVGTALTAEQIRKEVQRETAALARTAPTTPIAPQASASGAHDESKPKK